MVTSFAVNTTGADVIKAKFAAVANKRLSIARSAVAAGIGVLAKVSRAAVPGTIKREIGKTIKPAGSDSVTGRAGLMKFPKRGVRGKQAHGIFLERGTKYIQPPRRYVGGALAGSRARALAAMERAVRRKVESIVSSN